MLREAIDAVSYRQYFIDEAAFNREHVDKALHHLKRLPYEKNITQQLTNKELLYLQFLVTMEDEVEIAKMMHVSLKTLQYYATCLRKKTDTHSKTALLLFAIKNRWLKVYKAYVSSNQ